MHILFNKLTSHSSFLPVVQRTPGGLQLLNLESYPKNLKTWENLSYKNDFIPNNLTSQSKDKAYTPCLHKCVKTSPPLLKYTNVKILQALKSYLFMDGIIIIILK